MQCHEQRHAQFRAHVDEPLDQLLEVRIAVDELAVAHPLNDHRGVRERDSEPGHKHVDGVAHLEGAWRAEGRGSLHGYEQGLDLQTHVFGKRFSEMNVLCGEPLRQYVAGLAPRGIAMRLHHVGLIVEAGECLLVRFLVQLG